MTGTASPQGGDVRCQQVVELVTDYLEDALDADLRSRVEAHLADCDGCQEYLEQMRTTVNLLGRVPVDTLSQQARTDLLAAFRDFHAAGPADGR
ncbi:MAG TPA: zf-HC2 domain-containing protein [Jiangellales bacterium]|nr:zf-HC2 domain-containing protein [Jiangellales bacterium]